MRHGRMGSQLGADQKYYISRCQEKQSIQLTITMVGTDEEHIEERRNLINDVENLLHELIKLFMPAKATTTEWPVLMVPCTLCPKLHILLEDVRNCKKVFCPNFDDNKLPDDYYYELQGGVTSCNITAGKVVIRKLSLVT